MELSDAWQTSARTLLDRIFQKWSPSDKQSTQSLCDHLMHFMRSFSHRVFYPDDSRPPMVKVGSTERLLVFIRPYFTCSISPVTKLSLFYLYLQTYDLISEKLVQILKGEPKEEFPGSCRNISPLVLGLSVFLITRKCDINLGVKGWADLCLLVSSETAMDRKNLDTLCHSFPNPQQ